MAQHRRLIGILKDFLSCNICSETLKDPVSLGCNHNYCQPCLTKLCEKQSDKECHLCRRRISRDLDVNFSLKELADCFADTQDLVDWNKPLVWQVGHLREKYATWVHKPVDRPIRLFESNFVEAVTTTTWWVVPVLWLPIAIWLIYNKWTVLSRASDNAALIFKYDVPLLLTFVGLLFWIFLTYCIHRLFHRPPPAHNYYLITLHFVLHGQHHKNPNDDSRLVFPPALSILMMGILWLVLRLMLPEGLDLALLLGIICGYVMSDMVHYYLHHGSPSEGSWFYSVKKSHIKHHYEHPDKGLGITTTWFDSFFNTDIPNLPKAICSKDG